MYHFFFLIVQHVGIDAGLERRIKHEPVEKIISIACLAEPYVSPPSAGVPPGSC